MTDIKYSGNGKIAVFNGNKYVRDDKTGYYLCHDGYGAGHRLHRDVWEFYNCKIPKGYDVHHKDRNKGNNDIENLQLMKNGEHQKLHGSELTEAQKEWKRKNLLENAVPLSKEWHRSEEGVKWHSENGKKMMQNRTPRRYICSFCGKEFETIKYYGEKENTFCSNACKSAHRRKTGVDSVERICEFCGNKFKTNKYSKGKYCSLSCGKKAYWKNKRG